MDSKKSNKISEIVRLQQILKKWKKLANAPRNSNKMAATALLPPPPTMAARASNTSSMLSTEVVPKGFLAVCVGKELKRFIILTEYLGHQAFGVLLREAEGEFGFQQEGVLKIPCEVAVFEKILEVVEEKRDHVFSSMQRRR
ncbi:hypothetical protein AAG906_001840 [Vitis piasezkii]